MRAFWFRVTLASLGFLPCAAALAQGSGTNLVDFLHGTSYGSPTLDERGIAFTYQPTAPWNVGDNFFLVDFSDIGKIENRGGTGQMSVAWNYPFSLVGQSFTVEGFLDVVGSEGASGGSVHTRPQLVWKASSRVNLGLEYQYWSNEQGNEGFTESAMQGMLRVNF